MSTLGQKLTFVRFAFNEEQGIFNFDVFDEANWEHLAELASVVLPLMRGPAVGGKIPCPY